MQKKKTPKVKSPKPAPKGFTLIELLVVIGIIGILAAVVLVAVNPGKQFAQARNTQRQAAIASILDAVDQNMTDHNGLFSCASYPTLPSTTMYISNDQVDIWKCLAPDYLAVLPIDPSVGVSMDSDNKYNTQFQIIQDPVSSRVTVSAPYAELSQNLSITR